MKEILISTVLATIVPLHVHAMAPEVLTSASKSALTSFVIPPKAVVWKSDKGVSNSENLLKTHSGQAVLIEPVPPLVLKPGAGLVIDFGVEIAGSIELFTPMTKVKEMAAVRIRFGESVAETMASGSSSTGLWVIVERGVPNSLDCFLMLISG